MRRAASGPRAAILRACRRLRKRDFGLAIFEGDCLIDAHTV